MDAKQNIERLVIADAEALLALDQAGLLHLLIKDEISVSVTDAALHLASAGVRDFIARHAAKISIAPTPFHEHLAQLKNNPDIAPIPDMGDLSIYGYLAHGDKSAMVLLHDDRIARHQIDWQAAPHLLPLSEFLSALRPATRIVSNPRILCGIPVVEGSRVPAGTVMTEVQAGTSRDEIFRHYPSLPSDGIEACIEWDRCGRPGN